MLAGSPGEVRVKVVVERFTSNPGLTFEAQQALKKALHTVAEWFEQGGLGDAKVDVASIDVDLPVTMARADSPAAHLAIAEKIAVSLRSSVAAAHGDPVVVQGGQTTAGGRIVETIRTAGRQGWLNYYDSDLMSRIAAGKKRPRLAEGDLGPKLAMRPMNEAEVAASWDELRRIIQAAHEEYSRETQHIRKWQEKEDKASKIAAEVAPKVVEHLRKVGVTASLDAAQPWFVVVAPENGGSRLNTIALSLLRNQGVTLKIDCRSKIQEPRELGYYQWRTKTLAMDFEEGVAEGKVSHTMLHEVIHSYQALLREAGIDPTTSLEAHGKLPTGLTAYQGRFGRWNDFYSTFMSTEELLTFSRDLHTTSARQLRGEAPRTVAADLRNTLVHQAQMLRGICGNVIGVAERAIPRLRATATTGKEDEHVDMGTHVDKDTGKTFESVNLPSDYHWRLQELAVAEGAGDDVKAIAERKEKSFLGKVFSSATEAKEARMRVASRMLEKLEVLQAAGNLINELARLIEREAYTLEAGKDVLTTQGVHTLRGLAGWPGYIARLANAPELSPKERLAAVQEQRRRFDAVVGPLA